MPHCTGMMKVWKQVGETYLGIDIQILVKSTRGSVERPPCRHGAREAGGIGQCAQGCRHFVAWWYGCEVRRQLWAEAARLEAAIRPEMDARRSSIIDHQNHK